MANPKPLPPCPIPLRRRTFAHILAVDMACPHCGRLYPFPKDKRGQARGPRAATRRQQTGWTYGYDPIKGTFSCHCGKTYVLGVVMYPRAREGGGHWRLEDTRPTLEEAAILRGEASGPAERPLEGRLANVVAADEVDMGERRPTGRRDSRTGQSGEGPDR